jgi:hypothetical protein
MQALQLVGGEGEGDRTPDAAGESPARRDAPAQPSDREERLARQRAASPYRSRIAALYGQ